MDATLVFEMITSIAIVLGVGIGLLQLRQYRLSRKRESAILILNSYQTKDFLRGIWQIAALPYDLSKNEIEKSLDHNLDHIYLVMSTWESIGILLFNREISIDLIDQAYSGPILISWQKLEEFITELRNDLNRDTLFEWFQWLNERMKEREHKQAAVPAYIEHRKWK